MVLTFLLNEKRSVLQSLEMRHKVGIVVLPSKHLETPAYDIERIKSAEGEEEGPALLQEAGEGGEEAVAELEECHLHGLR